MHLSTGRLLRGPALVALGLLVAGGACSSDTGSADDPDAAVDRALAAARSADEVVTDDDSALGIQADVDTVLGCLTNDFTVGDAPVVVFDGDGAPGVAVLSVPPGVVEALRGATDGDTFRSCVHDAVFGDLGQVSPRVTLDVATARQAHLGDQALEVEIRLHAGPLGLGDDIVVASVDDFLVVGRVSSQSDQGDIDHAAIQAPLEAAVRSLSG